MMLHSFRFQIRRGSRQSSAVTRWLAQRPRKSNERRLRLSYCLEKRERSSGARLNNCGFRIADFGLNNLTISIADIGIYSGNLNSRLDCSIRNPQSEIERATGKNSLVVSGGGLASPHN